MVEFPKYKLQLLQIRNPWGIGRMWKGAFSDESDVWDKYPGLKEQIKFERGNDGQWWMTY